MGFLDGLLGRKEAEPRVERIEFSQLPGWLEERKRKLVGGLDEQAEPLIQEIPGILEKIGEDLNELKAAKMQKDVQQRIKSLVSSSRDNYVKRIKRAIEDIDADAGSIELSEELKDILGEIRKVDQRYSERVYFGFKKELSKVKKGLNDLVNLSNGLKELIGQRKERLQAIEDAERELKEIRGELAGLSDLEGREKEVASVLEDLRFKKGEAEKGIKEIENSDRAEKLASINLELKDLKGRKKEIETLMLNILGPLRRIFKKYARAVKDGKASGMNVDKYADNPVDTYLRGEQTLPELLAKVQKAIQTDLLGLDSGEGEKSLKKIRAISFSHMEKTRSEYNTVVSRIRTLETKARGLDIGKEIDKSRREIEGLEAKITGESKKLDRIKGDIEEEKRRMEDMNRKLAKKLSEFIGGRCELT